MIHGLHDQVTLRYKVIMKNLFVGLAIAAAFALAGLLCLEWAGATLRPPQPLPLGTLQWDYETAFTVDRVDRLDVLRVKGRSVRARGQFYVVDVRVLCPYGERYHWDDRRVEVRTFSGFGGTMRDRRFMPDPQAQALLDGTTGRRVQHTVIGAQEHDRLVYDLPRNVEQPGIVFLDANDPSGLLDVIFGHFWQPARFNLRYD